MPAPPDYAALARQYGGVVSGSGGKDYASLAKQFGGAVADDAAPVEDPFPTPWQTAGDTLAGIGTGAVNMGKAIPEAIINAQDPLNPLRTVRRGVAGISAALAPGNAGAGERVAAALDQAAPEVMALARGTRNVLTPAFRMATQNVNAITPAEMHAAAHAGGEGIAALAVPEIAARGPAVLKFAASKGPAVAAEALGHYIPLIRPLVTLGRNLRAVDKFLRAYGAGDMSAAAEAASESLKGNPEAAKAYATNVAEAEAQGPVTPAQSPAAQPEAQTMSAPTGAPPATAQTPTAAVPQYRRPPGPTVGPDYQARIDAAEKAWREPAKKEPAGKPLSSDERELRIRQLEAAKAAGVDLAEAFGSVKTEATATSRAKPTALESKLKASLQPAPNLGEIENKIVGLKSLSGLSDAQVAQALRNVYGITPSAGLKMLNMLRAAGRI